MSYRIYITYGYGIKVSDIPACPVSHIQEMLKSAPKLNEKINSWFASCEITEPTFQDYEEFDQVYYLGLATLLKETILEAEGLEFTACSDYDGNTYLLYEPVYPWQLPESERDLTPEYIDSILTKYIKILDANATINIDYHEAENGG